VVKWGHPTEGQTRTRWKFCWFPLYDVHENVTYWLTAVLITEKFQTVEMDCWWEQVKVEEL